MSNETLTNCQNKILHYPLYYFVFFSQIEQVNQERESLKREFREHLDKSSDEVAQFHEEMLQRITELEVSYISATDLTDRRSNKRLMEEFDDMSTELTEINGDSDEKEYVLHTPYLHTGNKM